MKPATDLSREAGVVGDPSAGMAPVAQDDPRVVQALEEYIDLLEAGRRPTREAFLAAHPNIAEALAKGLEGLQFVYSAPTSDPTSLSALSAKGEGGTRESAAAGEDLQPAVPLGDFRIVRQIGRGGMGVVYEAVQLSLGRRVALKVLPFAAGMDPRQLQRFKNEAHAAAHLHHSHIVPIYSVGCERGLHYYAMQLIEGPTLSEVIRQLQRRPPAARPPAAPPAVSVQSEQTTTIEMVAGLSTEHSPRSPAFFRAVAALGIQAAEALEHAHQLGIVHRDIKPANLMVDLRSHLWVTDFGLAQMHADTPLTLTGDMVGTLRYMSPEQALGKRGAVDARSDIYALGATLYELLTLQPALTGRDRQEILRQIAFEEPRPLRRINAAVPVELETIVIKAMAKEPEGRHGSAQELADDLRRYLEDQPIRARRPGVRQRGVRWLRRHRSLVWLAACTLVLATLGATAAAILIARERAAAVRERNQAQRHARKAVAAYNLLMATELKLPSEDLDLNGQRRERLERALGFYQDLLREDADQPELQAELADARQRLAQIHNDLAWVLVIRPDAPAADVQRGIQLAGNALTYAPQNWTYWNTLGVAHYRAGTLEQAREALLTSLRLKDPADKQRRGEHDSFNSFFLAMTCWKLGRHQEAMTWYQRGVNWMEANYPKEPILVAFRAEAATLLGVQRPSPGEVPHEPNP